MEKAIEQLQDSARELDKMAAGTNMALVEMRTQFETLASMQQEERLQIQKMHHEEISKIIERNDKQIAQWKHIVIGLILTICLIIGSLVGAAIYIATNYEIVTGTYQDVSSDNSSTVTIHDGIHVNGD